MIVYNSYVARLIDEGEFAEIASAIQTRRKNLGVSLNNALNLTITVYQNLLQLSMLFMKETGDEPLGIEVMEWKYDGVSFDRVAENLEYLYRRLTLKSCKAYCTLTKQGAEWVG
jgi:hypothetical protein